MNRTNPLANSYAYGSQNPYFSRPDATWTDEERQRIAEEKRMVARYKTSLCTDFKATGKCMYGDNCRFADGPEELREKPQPKNVKTVLCRNFENYGICPYGGRCLFIHRGKSTNATGSASFTDQNSSNRARVQNPLSLSSVGQRPPNRLSEQVNRHLNRVNPLSMSHMFDRSNTAHSSGKDFHEQLEEVRKRFKPILSLSDNKKSSPKS